MHQFTKFVEDELPNHSLTLSSRLGMPRRKRPDPLAQIIGQRLCKLRRERGLTAEKVAYESDVSSKGYLSDIEHGLALPSLRTLERLAKYLEVELFDLLTNPESELRDRLVDKTRHLAQGELEQMLRELDSLGHAPGELIERPVLRAVRAYPTLEVAAGWSKVAQSAARVPSEFVRLPGSFERGHDFAVRASGTSMQGWRSEIRDGDWLVLRWSRIGARAADGRVALVAREDKYGDRSLHIKRVVCSDGRVLFRSDDPSVPPVVATDADAVLAVLRAVVRPESLAPKLNIELSEQSLARAFGLRSAPKAPWARVDGHLFLVVRASELSQGRLAMKVPDPRPAESAFVLLRGRTVMRYLGVARFDVERGRWVLQTI
jgi:transcriptional regulator with XRE-family HTH domain